MTTSTAADAPTRAVLPQDHVSTEPADLQSSLSKGQGAIDAYASTFQPSWRFYVAFSSLLIITAMAALDATSLSPALPIITRALHGTSVEGFWAGTSFSLCCTVVMPVYGSFSDIFGRKPMIYISLVLFGLGAILAAVAHDSFTLMLVGRSVQGMGGGGILVLTEVVVTDLVPLRFRGNFFSGFAAMWALGSISGPLIGAAFAQKASWRWIFWLNLPFIAIGAPLIALFLKLFFAPTSLAQKLRRVDWVGGFLFIASITGFLIPISWAGTMYSWSSWHTLVPMLVSAAGLVAFVVWEERFAADPLIRLSVTKSRSAAVTYFGDFLQGLILWCTLYYQPLYFQIVKQASPISSSVDLLPGTLTVAPAAVVVGAMITRFGRYRWAIWIGWALAALGMGLRVLQNVDTPTYAWVLYNLSGGIGVGMLFPSLSYAIQAGTPNKDQAYGVSLYVFFRSMGQAVGVAVGGSIFQNSVKQQILKRASIAAHADEWSASANLLMEVAQQLSGDVKLDLLHSAADALNTIWWVMLALSLIGLFTSLFTQHFDLNRELETDQGFKHDEKKRDEEDSAETIGAMETK